MKTNVLYLVGLSLIVSMFVVSCETESFSPESENHSPVIQQFSITPDQAIASNDTVTLHCQAADFEGDLLTYNWWVSSSTGLGEWPDGTSRSTVTWTPAGSFGEFRIGVTVADDYHQVSQADTVVVPDPSQNQPPSILGFELTPAYVTLNDTVYATCLAEDQNEDDELQYFWTADGGELLDNHSAFIRWVAPGSVGAKTLFVSVSDLFYTVRDSMIVTIHEEPATYSTDFSTDEVTDVWSFAGLLSGMGNTMGPHLIRWNQDLLAMEALGISDNGTFAFRMADREFVEGTFSITIKVTNYQFSRVEFIPKFRNTANWYMVGINFNQQSWHIIRCVDGTTTWVIEGWRQFDPDTEYELKYSIRNGDVTVWINDEEIFQTTTQEAIHGEAEVAVGVSALSGADPVVFDNLHITFP